MLSTFGATGRRGPILLVLFIVAVILAACGGASGAASGAPVPGDAARGVTSGSTAGEDTDGLAAGPQGDGGTGSGNGPGDGGKVNYLSDTPNLLIIKTGEMVVQVTGIDDAVTKATDQIKALGGYASGSNRSGEGESDQASITFRIPADRWDEAVAALHGLATKVLTERSGTQDVTTQVVDLAARITNLRATETALQGVMTRAVEIKDILAVQQQLTEVRGQIEQAVAEKTHLEGQAAYSTLTVTFSLKPDPIVTTKTQFDPASQVDQAAASLVGILQAVASAGIWFGIVWLPILIVLAIIAFIVIRVLRRFAGSNDAPGAPTAPAAPAAPAAESGA